MEPANYECMICMDLLIEPVTIQCGHTFCKLCLANCISTTHKCPICRKSIYQSIDNISKNFLLESLIKEKYPEKYQQKMESLSAQYQKLNTDSQNINNAIPSLIVPNVYVLPQMMSMIAIPMDNNQVQVDTIAISSINDKMIVLIPTNELIHNRTIICSLCEISEITYRNDPKRVILKLKGVKRVQLLSFYNHIEEEMHRAISLSNSMSVVDDTIDSDDIKKEIIDKLHDIESYHKIFLHNAPIRLANKIEVTFGKAPKVPSSVENYNKKAIEGVSMYYLGVMKNEGKMEYYTKTNVFQRVKWLHEKYSDMLKFKDNIALTLLFYDIEGIKGETSWKFLLGLIIVFMIFGLLTKYRMFKP